MKFENQKSVYYFKGVKILLEKNSTSIRATVCVPIKLYPIEKVGSVLEVRDYNNTLHFSILNKQMYQKFVDGDYLLVKTKWKSFNAKWHKLPYQNLQDNICVKQGCEGTKISLTIPKKKYIPDDWFGSYNSFKKRKEDELKRSNTPHGCGYISNRNKADYVVTNIYHPWSGGKFSHN